MRDTSTDLILDQNYVYSDYQSQAAQENIEIPPVLGSTAITVVNGITGPTIDFTGGTTGYSFAPAGTDVVLTVSNAATVRSSIGLGTMAVQNSGAVSITGGSITGITDLAIADGGTGASTAAVARTNLSVPRVTVALVAPAVTDDGANGFPIGSLWVDSVLKDGYLSVDASTGAAVWDKITP